MEEQHARKMLKNETLDDSDEGLKIGFVLESDNINSELKTIEEEIAEISQSRQRRKRTPKKIVSDIDTSERLPLSVFTCEYCSKLFKNKGSLCLHLRTHSGYRPHVCSQCGKGFAQIGALQTHMRIHTGVRPFKCTECDKSFAQQTGLNQHLRTHSGHQPYECLICFKKFTQVGSLRNHERTHSGEKPFVCIECGRSFTQKGSLNTHMRTHTNERPFSCDICDKSFTQKIGLVTHQKSHMAKLPGLPALSEVKNVERSVKTEHKNNSHVLHLSNDSSSESVVVRMDNFSGF